MMELAKKVLAARGYENTTPLELKTDLDLQALAKDGVVPVVFQCDVTTDKGTYATEIWLFDHGKKGISKLLKKTPRFGSEEERRENNARIQDALQMMLRDKYCAAT